VSDNKAESEPKPEIKPAVKSEVEAAPKPETKSAPKPEEAKPAIKSA